MNNTKICLRCKQEKELDKFDGVSHNSHPHFKSKEDRKICKECLIKKINSFYKTYDDIIELDLEELLKNSLNEDKEFLNIFYKDFIFDKEY